MLGYTPRKTKERNLTPQQEARVIELNKRGINLVNEGQLREAIETFTDLLSIYPDEYVGLVGRGSAFSLGGHLDRAIADFTTAIEAQPDVAEAWKRRGQTHAAANHYDEAIADLSRATKLMGADIDIYQQRGILYHSHRDYTNALKDLRKVLRQTKHPEPLLYNYLGQCYLATGSSEKAITVYQKALAHDANFKEAWTNSAQAALQLSDARRTLDYARKALAIDPAHVITLGLEMTLWYGLGRMHVCGAVADRCLEVESENNACRFMAGMVAQSQGRLSVAIKHYNSLLEEKDDHYAFYQREWAIYQQRNLDRSIWTFNPDRELDGWFKEYYTMREPWSVMDHYTLQIPALEPAPDVRVVDAPTDDGGELDAGYDASAAAVVAAADEHFSTILQLRTPGFLSNGRQHRQAGIAAIQMAQQMRARWDSTSADREHLADGFAGSDARNEDDHEYGWRDLMDVAVKWRQLVSCNDSVWWIDQLGRWDDSDALEGFGLRTPMVSGQLRVVRYYPYFRKAFEATRSLVVSQLELDKKQAVRMPHVTTLKEAHDVVGRDFWVTSLCQSEYEPGRIMEGTRLTVEAAPPNGYEFTIRTPGTPQRWVQYAEEMDHQFDRLSGLVAGIPRGDRDDDAITEVVLKIFFYWVNFAPLSRGSAATGYTVMHALFLAAGYEIADPIPKGMQADWEAILTPNPDDFVAAMRSWIYGSRRRIPHRIAEGTQQEVDWLDDVEDASRAINTYRKMLRALNAGDNPDRNHMDQ